MATSQPGPGPAQKLVELLEGLPTDDRKEITAWLLGLAPNPAMLRFAVGSAAGSTTASLVTDLPQMLQPLLPRLASGLPAGEESQLVTIRLPAERHAQLRRWCTEHGFTMASVVRGLVERFLEQQAPPAKA
jgi:hypothetical protein